MSQLAISGFNPALGMQARRANAFTGQLAPQYNASRLQSEPLFSGRGLSLNSVNDDVINLLKQIITPQTLSAILNHEMTQKIFKMAHAEGALGQLQSMVAANPGLLNAASQATPDEIRRGIPPGVLEHIKKAAGKDPLVVQAVAAGLVGLLGMFGIELAPEIAILLAIAVLSEVAFKGGKALGKGFLDTWKETGNAVKDHQFLKAYLRAGFWFPLTIKKAFEHFTAKPEKPADQIEAPADTPSADDPPSNS